MSSPRVPVLWLFGPSGVGKTTVAREIAARLGSSGVKAALVDTDMIGLCRPESADDPEHHRLKARNLAALWSVLHAAGAQCLLLAGGVEHAGQLALYVHNIAGAELTVCQLSLGEADHRARIMERNGRSVAWIDDLIEEGKDLDHNDFTDVRVDTGGLSVGESAERILDAAGRWPVIA
ncbi:AAA family ATPase [Krasilnikovia sp. MM14-A1259]|uniref:AAA family ATPase n=1 Tax=Krasilnikovia sp. MM14-A1259 TaxID=3373539 RepID=UPI0038275048